MLSNFKLLTKNYFADVIIMIFNRSTMVEEEVVGVVYRALEVLLELGMSVSRLFSTCCIKVIIVERMPANTLCRKNVTFGEKPKIFNRNITTTFLCRAKVMVKFC